MSTLHRPRPRTVLAALGLTAIAALAGCDGTSTTPVGTAAGGGTATRPAGTSTGSTGPTSTAPAAGCPATGGGVPTDAASVTTVDLDADGRPDTLWLTTVGSGTGRAVGVTTATGATTSLPVDLAGPAGATALALGPDAGTADELLVTDGRLADLLIVRDCTLVAVTDADGAPWQFDLGYTGYGTGTGCVDVGGTGSTVLAGLDLTDGSGTGTGTGTGTAQTVTRTAIDVTGTVAAAGVSDRVTVQPDDTAALDSARTITCGDRTLADDGVHEPQS
ncbi:MAG TPA: hypothetical protein VGC67_02865 [Cellulomonas sp.]